MSTAIRPEEQVIDIGEAVGQHPRTPGPRLMRPECLGMAQEMSRRVVQIHRLAQPLLGVRQIDRWQATPQPMANAAD